MTPAKSCKARSNAGWTPLRVPTEGTSNWSIVFPIKDFINFVFLYLGLNWKNYVFEDSKILKRSFNGTLFGDASKLTKLTGWKPRVSLKKLAKLMVDSEIKIFNEKN